MTWCDVWLSLDWHIFWYFLSCPSGPSCPFTFPVGWKPRWRGALADATCRAAASRQEGPRADIQPVARLPTRWGIEAEWNPWEPLEPLNLWNSWKDILSWLRKDILMCTLMAGQRSRCISKNVLRILTTFQTYRAFLCEFDNFWILGFCIFGHFGHWMSTKKHICQGSAFSREKFWVSGHGATRLQSLWRRIHDKKHPWWPWCSLGKFKFCAAKTNVQILFEKVVWCVSIYNIILYHFISFTGLVDF